MGQFSEITWCDHTMNFWIGCTKVSEGCKNCYAAVDTFARRERSHGNELWGPTASRHRTSEMLWKNPFLWNRKSEWLECSECGWRGHLSKMIFSEGMRKCPMCASLSAHPTRQRVFCQSLSDICEEHPQITNDMRVEIANIVTQCENLDFLFLTKRPENFNRLWLDHFSGTLPPNFIPGTSTENQKTANIRIPHLLDIPARRRFLSCGPLLGEIDLLGAMPIEKIIVGNVYDAGSLGIDLVIVEGESGPHARPMKGEWARFLRDQCELYGIPFHFKQWGEYDESGQKVGKKNAGRILDGIYHNASYGDL